jgi:hypothetical protein
VLPRGFVKIRHYGLLANAAGGETAPLSPAVVPPDAAANVTARPTKAASDGAEIEPAQRPSCPRCGGCRLERHELSNATAAAHQRENSS